MKKLVDDTVSRHSRLDYIFNNAGIAVCGEVRDCTVGDWRTVLDVNLYGVIHGVSAAYRVMVKQGSGHIINTASIEGLIAYPISASYVASKHGVVGLSNSLRAEGADLGVKVTVVCSGLIDTALLRTLKMIRLDRDKFMGVVDQMKKTSPDECASVILRGVERNKAIIVVTPLAKMMWLLQRVSPGAIRWMMKRTIRQYRQARI